MARGLPRSGSATAGLLLFGRCEHGFHARGRLGIVPSEHVRRDGGHARVRGQAGASARGARSLPAVTLQLIARVAASATAGDNHGTCAEAKQGEHPRRSEARCVEDRGRHRGGRRLERRVVQGPGTSWPCSSRRPPESRSRLRKQSDQGWRRRLRRLAGAPYRLSGMARGSRAVARSRRGTSRSRTPLASSRPTRSVRTSSTRPRG
jgi:hypothetical protein